MYEGFSIVFFHSAGSDVLQPSPLATEFADLTPCDFFLWRFVKGSVFVPPLPTPVQELRERITHALQATTVDVLHRAWDESDYHVDLCRVPQGARTEGL
jgi:hypothetical protein